MFSCSCLLSTQAACLRERGVQARLRTTTPPHQRSDGLSLGASTDALGARNLTSFSPPSPQHGGRNVPKSFSPKGMDGTNLRERPCVADAVFESLVNEQTARSRRSVPQGSPASTWHIPSPSLRTAVNSTMEGSDENTDEGGRSGRGECCVVVARRR